MLDEYSEVRPRALNTRLSLESEYFCSLIELFYKERNGEKREIELNKSLSDRLYEILFQFKVTPGIDWNGNFDAKRFDYWMKTVKTWSRDNDRYEVAMHTVGSGLSYAELDEDKLPQTAVIEELNRVENEELRRGYYLGIINQRGVHWIDPEGKPELTKSLIIRLHTRSVCRMRWRRICCVRSTILELRIWILLQMRGNHPKKRWRTSAI